MVTNKICFNIDSNTQNQKINNNSNPKKELEGYKNLKFKLLNTGVSAEVDFDNIEEGPDKKGKLKSKLLNSNLKLNFIYDNNSLKINSRSENFRSSFSLIPLIPAHKFLMFLTL